MPFPNEHSFRIKSPSLFIKGTMRSKSLSDGIRLIAGKLKSNPDKMTAQAYRFKKDVYSVSQAKKWLSDNDIKHISFEPAVKEVQNFLREIKLQCSVLALSAQEISGNIPINVMASLKERDPHPYLRAYSIMQDGIASPRVIGESDALPTKWSKKIVESLKGVATKLNHLPNLGRNASDS